MPPNLYTTRASSRFRYPRRRVRIRLLTKIFPSLQLDNRFAAPLIRSVEIYPIAPRFHTDKSTFLQTSSPDISTRFPVRFDCLGPRRVLLDRVTTNRYYTCAKRVRRPCARRGCFDSGSTYRVSQIYSALAMTFRF